MMGSSEFDGPTLKMPRAAADPRRALLAGGVVVFLTFGVFGGWAALSPLASGAHVEGRVSIDTSRKTIQHFEGGIVQKINVHEGEFVQAGQILIEMDPIQARTQERVLFNRYSAFLMQEARLEAELKNVDHFDLPVQLSAVSGSEEISELYADQYAFFQARKNELARRIDILIEQKEQFELQIEGMQAEQSANRRQLTLITEELAGLRSLAKKGYVSVTRVRSLDREAARLEGLQASRNSEIARVRVGIGEIELQVEQIRETRQREIIDELGKVRSQISEISEQMNAAEDALRRTTIISPAAGQVVNLRVHTVGGVVRAGEALLDLVPKDDRLIVEARVRPVDADVVKAGQEAHVVFTGLPKRSSPHLEAVVLSISTDALEDPNGNLYYLARVEVLESALLQLEETDVVSGMPVDVLIKAGERTLLEYIVAPWTDLFFKAMREY